MSDDDGSEAAFLDRRVLILEISRSSRTDLGYAYRGRTSLVQSQTTREMHLAHKATTTQALPPFQFLLLTFSNRPGSFARNVLIPGSLCQATDAKLMYGSRRKWSEQGEGDEEPVKGKKISRNSPTIIGPLFQRFNSRGEEKRLFVRWVCLACPCPLFRRMGGHEEEDLLAPWGACAIRNASHHSLMAS